MIFLGSSTHDTTESEDEIVFLGCFPRRTSEKQGIFCKSISSGNTSTDYKVSKYSKKDKNSHGSQGMCMI